MEIEDDTTVSIEDRARAMGWKPRDEYRGDPRRWTDAAEFIEHGEAELPILRDQGRRMSEKLAKQERELENLRNTVAEQTQAVRDAMDLARRADDRGYQRGLAELKAKQREAVEAGDTVAFDQVSEQITAAERERLVGTPTPTPTPPPPPTIEPPPPTIEPPRDEQWPETKAFLADNPWFHRRATLRKFMIEEHAAACETYPDLSRAEQYQVAKEAVADAFPQFRTEIMGPEAPQPNRNEPPVEGEPRPRRILKSPTLAPSRPIHRDVKTSPFDRIADPTDRQDAIEAHARMQRSDPTFTAEMYIGLMFGEISPLDTQALRRKA
jgi:hypothetical protein